MVGKEGNFTFDISVLMGSCFKERGAAIEADGNAYFDARNCDT